MRLCDLSTDARHAVEQEWEYAKELRDGSTDISEYLRARQKAVMNESRGSGKASTKWEEKAIELLDQIRESSPQDIAIYLDEGDTWTPDLPPRRKPPTLKELIAKHKGP